MYAEGAFTYVRKSLRLENEGVVLTAWSKVIVHMVEGVS